MPELLTNPTEDLPPPSAEIVLWRVQTEALIAVLGRKKADRFLRIMAETVASEENLSAIFNIRPTGDAVRVRTARRQAAEVLRRYLPIFNARLPR